MKKLLVIDWILIIAYVLSACSGIELHIAGHGNSHETWYNRAMFHAIMSFLFFVDIYILQCTKTENRMSYMQI